MIRTPRLILLGLLLLGACILPTDAQQRWQTLPPTPSLPSPTGTGFVEVKGARIWYATFGNVKGPAVTLLHGGVGNSNYWGHLVRTLSPDYHVVVMDSRGHGRSPYDGKPISYEQMADDMIVVLDALKIERSAAVGWSDGANTGIYLGLKYGPRITGLFLFAGNYHINGMQKSGGSAAASTYFARVQKEYLELSPAPKAYAAFRAALSAMWRAQPQLARAELKKITVPVWVVQAEREELIAHPHAKEMAAAIPNAKFVSLPGVGHFALLQDPAHFDAEVVRFMQSLR